MKYPSFVPIAPSERKKRQTSALIIEIFVWTYFFVFLVKILFISMIMPFIENLAFQNQPKSWAVDIINRSGFDSRYFEFPLYWFGILFAFGAAIGTLVALKGQGFGHWIASLSKLQPKTPEEAYQLQNYWKYAKIEALLLVLVTVVTGWVITDINFGKIFEQEGLLGALRLKLQLICGIPGAGSALTSSGNSFYDGYQWLVNSFISGYNSLTGSQAPLLNVPCVPNDLSYFYTALGKLVESIYLAFMATFFSVPVAFILSFFASRNLTRHSATTRLFYVLIRVFMNITRSIEPLIWAILFSVWIGIGPFAGSLALFIHSVASLVKQYSESVESVDNGPLEAIQTTGASRIAVVWHAVVPQVVLPYLAFTIYRWDINVRMATIIGLVGGGGIGSILIQEQMLARWTQVGSLAFLIFLVVWSMDFLSAHIREAIQ